MNDAGTAARITTQSSDSITINVAGVNKFDFDVVNDQAAFKSRNASKSTSLITAEISQI